MIVYNLSMKVDLSIEKEWLQWQKTEHIPEVMASGQFTDHKLYKLLEQEDSDAAIYVVQYFCVALDNYHHYVEHTAPLLRQKVFDKWGDKFIAFRTVMQLVN
jgi:Domain of unknown function (DUF4286)